MENKQEERSNLSPSQFGNVFVGCRESWQVLPLAVREACNWLENPPEACNVASFILLDGNHPDCLTFLERSCVPVIILCTDGSRKKTVNFKTAGALDILSPIDDVAQIVSILRVAGRLSAHFNQLLEETDRKQTKTLLHTAKSIGTPHNLNQLLIQIADSVMDVVDAEGASMIRVDMENARILDVVVHSRWSGEPPKFTYSELLDGLSGWAMRTKEIAVSSGFAIDGREKQYVQERRIKSNTGALIVIPLMCHNDEVSGTFAVSRKQGQPDFTQKEVDIVATMVQMGVVAIQNAQLDRDVRDALDQTQILLNVAKALISSDSTAALLDQVLKEVINGLNGTGGMYIHYDVDKDRIISSERFTKHDDLIKRQSIANYRMFMGGLSGYAIRSKSPILSNKQNDERQSEAVYNYRIEEHTGCVIVAPIINGETVLGTISVHRRVNEPAFTEKDLGILTAVANQIASALIHVRSFEDTKLRVDILAKRLEQRNHDLETRNDELRRANKQLQQVDKLKDKFINEVSHELRRPVSAFRLYLDLLEKRPQHSARYLQTLNTETHYFEELITAILDLARLHIVDTKVQGEPVDFADLIRRQVGWYRPQIEAKNIVFEEKFNPLPIIEGIRNLLDKVVGHLLKNALLYTDKGWVTVSCGEEIGTIWFQVEDSGIGIPEHEISSLYHRFYRGKQVVEQKRPGIGLGLSFVHEITKLHGGTMNITSVEGMGSTFRVTLPKRQ